jgi:undecaprenyl-diphosphatase
MTNVEHKPVAPPAQIAERSELLPIAALGGTAMAAGAFAWLAEEVGEGDTRVLDAKLLLALREASDPANPIGPPWLEETARDFTALGSNGVLVFAVLAASLFLVLARKRATAATLLAATSGGLLLGHLLKDWFERPRPELVPHAARVFTASFPSGHATMSAVVYLTLGALLARAQPDRRLKVYFGTLAVVLTLLVGASRIYLGVHWPSDVLAGWCVGSAWAMACWAVARWLQHRGVVRSARGGAGERRAGTAGHAPWPVDGSGSSAPGSGGASSRSPLLCSPPGCAKACPPGGSVAASPVPVPSPQEGGRGRERAALRSTPSPSQSVRRSCCPTPLSTPKAPEIGDASAGCFSSTHNPKLM